MKEQLEAVVLEMHRRGVGYAQAVRHFKQTFIATVLRANSGNQLKSARQLGMHRNTLSRTIAQLQIDLAALRSSTRRRPPQAERQLATHKAKRLLC